jgi:type I restriction enzyme S subunit
MYKIVKLQDISESIDYGFTTAAKNLTEGSRLLRITDIQNDSVDWDSVPFCECSEKDIEKYSLKYGDIVFARTGATTGKSFLIRNCPDNSVFASYLIRVRPSKEIDPIFLSRFFQSSSYWHQITQNQTGTTQPGVNSTRLKSLKIPLPPIAEQKRIAEILDKADAVRRKRQEAIRLTEELLRSTFLEMFGDPVTNPKGWDVVKLSDFAEIQSGIAKNKKIRSDSVISIPYMRVANIQDGYLDLSEIKEIQISKKDVSRYLLRHGDILLTEGGDPDKLGRGAVWRNEVEPCIHQNHIFCVRPDKNMADPFFLSSLIGSERGKRYFLRAAKQTTGIATINKTQLKAFPALLPPIKIQKKYAELVYSIERLKQTRQKETVEIENLFNSLLQRAFRGEL